MTRLGRIVRLVALLIGGLIAGALSSQEAATGSGGVLRVLDKISGNVRDLELANGETSRVGPLRITLGECRYPADNPAGDAFALLTLYYQTDADPVFRGWMIASEPSLNAMDHPRYDVWPLRCITS